MKKLVLALLILGCGEGAGQQTASSRVVMIFADVTSSLNQSQLTAVADLTSQVIAGLDPLVRYQVIPITIQTEMASPILDGEIPALAKPSERTRHRQALKQLPSFLRAQFSQLSGKVNNPGADPDRSCILGALSRAANTVQQVVQPAKIDIVLISDMIEECRQTPFDVPIRLNSPDISKQIADLGTLRSLPSLKAANLVFVIPPSNEQTTQARPSVPQLDRFWSAVALRAGFTPTDLQNKDRYYFGPGLPERFRR